MATPAYSLTTGPTIRGRIKQQYLFTTNTLASVLVIDFLNNSQKQINVGDKFDVWLVDDLTKVDLGTAAVTGFANYVCVTSTSTHVDLAIVYTSAFTNAT